MQDLFFVCVCRLYFCLYFCYYSNGCADRSYFQEGCIKSTNISVLNSVSSILFSFHFLVYSSLSKCVHKIVNNFMLPVMFWTNYYIKHSKRFSLKAFISFLFTHSGYTGQLHKQSGPCCYYIYYFQLNRRHYSCLLSSVSNVTLLGTVCSKFRSKFCFCHSYRLFCVFCWFNDGAATSC